MSSLQAKDYARYQAQARANGNGNSHDVAGVSAQPATNGTATAGPSAYASHSPSPARDAVNYAWPSSTARYPSQQQQQSQPGSPTVPDAQGYGATAGPSTNYGAGLGLGAPVDSARPSQSSSYRPSMDTLANQAYASTSNTPRQMRVSSQFYSSPNQSTAYTNHMSRQPSLVAGQHQPSPRRASHAPHPSQSTTIGPSASTRFPSSVDLSPSNTRPPLRSRTFGLSADMRPQTELADPAFFPGGIVPPEAATLAGADGTNKEQPIFSVELKAYSFDQRGYPVYGGRAASIQGSVRMRRVDESDVVVKVSSSSMHEMAAFVSCSPKLTSMPPLADLGTYDIWVCGSSLGRSCSATSGERRGADSLHHFRPSVAVGRTHRVPRTIPFAVADDADDAQRGNWQRGHCHCAYTLRRQHARWRFYARGGRQHLAPFGRPAALV